MSAQPSADGFVPWPKLSGTYFDPLENHEIARAQSALSGPDLGVVHDLTVEQARTVNEWYRPKY